MVRATFCFLLAFCAYSWRFSTIPVQVAAQSQEHCEVAFYCVPAGFEGKVPEGLTAVKCQGSCGASEEGCRQADQETPGGCSRYCCKAKCGCRCI